MVQFVVIFWSNGPDLKALTIGVLVAICALFMGVAVCWHCGGLDVVVVGGGGRERWRGREESGGHGGTGIT